MSSYSHYRPSDILRLQKNEHGSSVTYKTAKRDLERARKREREEGDEAARPAVRPAPRLVLPPARGDLSSKPRVLLPKVLPPTTSAPTSAYLAASKPSSQFVHSDSISSQPVPSASPPAPSASPPAPSVYCGDEDDKPSSCTTEFDEASPDCDAYTSIAERCNKVRVLAQKPNVVIANLKSFGILPSQVLRFYAPPRGYAFWGVGKVEAKSGIYATLIFG